MSMRSHISSLPLHHCPPPSHARHEAFRNLSKYERRLPFARQKHFLVRFIPDGIRFPRDICFEWKEAGGGRRGEGQGIDEKEEKAWKDEEKELWMHRKAYIIKATERLHNADKFALYFPDSAKVPPWRSIPPSGAQVAGKIKKKLWTLVDTSLTSTLSISVMVVSKEHMHTDILFFLRWIESFKCSAHLFFSIFRYFYII